MVSSRDDPRIAFTCEQEDRFASLRRQYILCFYYGDGSIDMRDVHTGKLVLKRETTTFVQKDFYIGATLLIRGRATYLTGYADAVTKQLCASKTESTVVIVSEDAFSVLGRYISMLTEECNFVIADVQMAWITMTEISKYVLPAELCNKRAVLLRCVRDDAVNKAYEFVERAPGTCAAQDAEQAELWNKMCMFVSTHRVAVFDELNTSVVIIKPHIIHANQAGAVLQQLLDAELEPTAFTQINLSSVSAMEFLQMYKGLWSNLSCIAEGFVGNVWVVQFMSYAENSNTYVHQDGGDDHHEAFAINRNTAAVTAAETKDAKSEGICGNNDHLECSNEITNNLNVVEKVRMLCGPYKPEIAQKLFPRSIRARFGRDVIHNAVHCCDLPSDGPLYADFFFKRVNQETVKFLQEKCFSLDELTLFHQ